MARPRKPEGEKSERPAPTGVRLPAEMRAQLERSAAVNGRTLSHEITYRLRTSLENPDLPRRLAHVRALEVGSAYAVEERLAQGSVAPQLGDTQRMLLSLFATLPPDKQLALLTFLKR